MPANERRTRSQLLAIATALLALVAVVALADSEAEDPTEPTGFAGADSCAECHPDEFDAWSKTAHSRTLRVARADILPREMAEGGLVQHSPGHTQFIRTGDRILAETAGPDGRPTRYEVSHVVGVRRIHMFLTETDPGRFQVLPAMFDIVGGEWFDYSHLIFGVQGVDAGVPPRIGPGEPTSWTGMTRFFDARCARCHTSGWSFRQPGDDGPFSSYRTMGIDCESCHGPAAGHVAWWSDEPPQGLTRDPILEYGKLDRSGAVSVCLRCHMEGEILDHGFTPGADYFDHFDPTLLDDLERVDATGRANELIYDGLSFLLSRCATEGELTCASCHAPHGSPYRSQLKSHARGNELCARCHAEEAEGLLSHGRHDPSGAGSGCIGCHMPFRSIERGHGAITDHTIGIPGPELRGACVACHTGRRGAPGGVPLLQPEAIAVAYREWWPEASGQPDWSAAIDAGRRRSPDGLTALIDLAGNPSAPRLVRASAVRLLGGYPAEGGKTLIRMAADEDTLVARNAVASLQAIRGSLSDAVLHKALLSEHRAVRHRAGLAALAGWERARENPSLLDALIPELRDRTVEVPEDDLAWFRLGAALQLAGDLRGAIGAYEQQLVLDPLALAVRRALVGLRKQAAEDD